MRILRSLMIVSLLFLFGCGSDSGKKVAGPVTPGDPTAELTAAYDALSSGDVAQANLHFKNALSIDPSNGAANLGVAVTEVSLLDQDPEVGQIFDLLGDALQTVNLSARRPESAPPARLLRAPRLRTALAAALQRMGVPAASRYDLRSSGRLLMGFLLRAAADPPPISAMQRTLRLKVLPKLDYVEARLNAIEALPAFSVMLPPRVTGLATDLEIDEGDVLVLDALVNLAQGTSRVLISYDVDVPSYNFVNAESLFTTPGSDFGTLFPDGSTQLAGARQDWFTAVSTMNQAVTSILSETDDQSDDLIPASAFGTASDIAGLREQLAQLGQALNGAVYVRFDNSYGMPDSVQVDAKVFFTNPIPDLKAVMPDHTFDAQHQFVADVPVNFPDPTFHGVLPGMTNDRLRFILGIPPA